MNEEIKAITEKYIMQFTGINGIEYQYATPNGLKQLLIEICELQKIECAKESKIRFWDGFHKEGKLIEHFQSGGDNLTPSKESILNTKNIAE